MNTEQKERTKKSGTKALSIILPCVAVLISLLIVLPQALKLSRALNAIDREITRLSPAQTATVQNAAETAGEPYLVSRQSVDSDSVSGDSLPLKLVASSMEHDLYITVRTAEGGSVSGTSFELTVTSPSGDVFYYYTGEDGNCNIVELPAGAYRIAMSDSPGYKAADPISCTVKSHIEYLPIPNITQIMEIVDVQRVADEVKDNTVTTGPLLAPEMIYTIEGSTSPSEVPVTDANGNTVYSYSYDLGPNGFLLYSSGLESTVLPIDEDNDDTLDYGLMYIECGESAESESDFLPVPEADGENALPTDSPSAANSGYYVSVILFNADNTPVADYAINATPLMQTVSSSTYGWRNENGHTYFYDASGSRITGLVNIDGKLYYFNQRGEKARALGIDVSYYNENIDWRTVKAQGIDFVFVRIGGRGWSSGLVYDDTSAQSYIHGAKSAGLKVGVYFYSTAINPSEAVQEASAALVRLNGVKLDYPIFIDMEYSGDYPMGRADTLSTAQRVEIINAFCKTIIASGYSAGLYTGQYFMNTALDYNSLSQYNIWLANYTNYNALPNFSGRYDIWQFTDGGQVNGISGPVDMNVIF